jgi:hypothetical protein
MGAFAGREPRWEIAGLIADSRTEAEIAARQPPSCIVAIKRNDGTLALLGAARGESRIAFDLSLHPEAGSYTRPVERSPRRRIVTLQLTNLPQGRAGAQCPLHLRIDLPVEYVP